MNSKTGWTEEAEVVIVGYGGAGAVTAIASHNAGAKVLTNVTGLHIINLVSG